MMRFVSRARRLLSDTSWNNDVESNHNVSKIEERTRSTGEGPRGSLAAAADNPASRRTEIKSLIWEVFFYGVFLSMLVTTAFDNREETAFDYSWKHVNPLNTHKNFSTYTKPAQIWCWMEKSLLPYMHNGSKLEPKPRKKPQHGKDYTLVGSHVSYRVGPTRIRQHRIQKHPCTPPGRVQLRRWEKRKNLCSANGTTAADMPICRCSKMPDPPKYCGGFEVLVPRNTTHCIPSWSSTPRAWESFKPCWNNQAYCPKSAEKTSKIIKEAFTYKTWGDIGGAPIPGRLGVYPPGGYVHNFDGNITMVMKQLKAMKSLYWIDEWTKVVIVEVTLYNPSINMFGLLTAIFEFPQAMTVQAKIYMHPFKLFASVGSGGYGAWFFDLFMVFCLGWFAYRIIKKLRLLKLHFFKMFWNVLEIVNFFLVMASWILYVGRQIVAKQASKDARRSTSAEHYYNYQSLALWDEIGSVLLGFSCCLTTLQVLHLCRFNRRLSLLGATMSRAGSDLLGFSVMFGLIMASFVSFSFMMYGWSVYMYSTVLGTIESLFLMSLGDLQYETLHAANKIFTPLFVLMYVGFIVFIVLNMLISILVDSFGIAREAIQHQANDFELIDYIVDRVTTVLKAILPVSKVSKFFQTYLLAPPEPPESPDPADNEDPFANLSQDEKTRITTSLTYGLMTEAAVLTLSDSIDEIDARIAGLWHIFVGSDYETYSDIEATKKYLVLDDTISQVVGEHLSLDDDDDDEQSNRAHGEDGALEHLEPTHHKDDLHQTSNQRNDLGHRIHHTEMVMQQMSNEKENMDHVHDRDINSNEIPFYHMDVVDRRTSVVPDAMNNTVFYDTTIPGPRHRLGLSDEQVADELEESYKHGPKPLEKLYKHYKQGYKNPATSECLERCGRAPCSWGGCESTPQSDQQVPVIKDSKFKFDIQDNYAAYNANDTTLGFPPSNIPASTPTDRFRNVVHAYNLLHPTPKLRSQPGYLSPALRPRNKNAPRTTLPSTIYPVSSPGLGATSNPASLGHIFPKSSVTDQATPSLLKFLKLTPKSTPGNKQSHVVAEVHTDGHKIDGSSCFDSSPDTPTHQTRRDLNQNYPRVQIGKNAPNFKKSIDVSPEQEVPYSPGIQITPDFTPTRSKKRSASKDSESSKLTPPLRFLVNTSRYIARVMSPRRILSSVSYNPPLYDDQASEPPMKSQTVPLSNNDPSIANKRKVDPFQTRYPTPIYIDELKKATSNRVSNIFKQESNRIPKDSETERRSKAIKHKSSLKAPEHKDCSSKSVTFYDTQLPCHENEAYVPDGSEVPGAGDSSLYFGQCESSHNKPHNRFDGTFYDVDLCESSLPQESNLDENVFIPSQCSDNNYRLQRIPTELANTHSPLPVFQTVFPKRGYTNVIDRSLFTQRDRPTSLSKIQSSESYPFQGHDKNKNVSNLTVGDRKTENPMKPQRYRPGHPLGLLTPPELPYTDARPTREKQPIPMIVITPDSICEEGLRVLPVDSDDRSTREESQRNIKFEIGSPENKVLRDVQEPVQMETTFIERETESNNEPAATDTKLAPLSMDKPRYQRSLSYPFDLSMLGSGRTINGKDHTHPEREQSNTSFQPQSTKAKQPSKFYDLVKSVMERKEAERIAQASLTPKPIKKVMSCECLSDRVSKKKQNGSKRSDASLVGAMAVAPRLSQSKHENKSLNSHK